MNPTAVLLAIELPTGAALLAGGLVIFAVAAGIMFIIFRMLKKSIKMAFRLAVAAAVIVLAVVGAVALWWFSSSSEPATRPAPTRKR